MEVKESSPRFKAAMHDFRRARQRAALESFIARLTGRSSRLVPYEEIPEQLRTSESIRRGRKMIPLDAIVGSVGRYTDFTRSFLPREKYAQKRWARVRSAFDNVYDMPPIVVYKMGESYFVLDGNHRVSVARVLGAKEIPAYVTEVETKVPLSPEVEPDALICQAQYASFLAETNLDELRPQSDLKVTAPGQYRVLRKQIDRYWAWLCREEGGDVPYSQAVAGWHDDVYQPLIDVIRRRGLLRYFPDRTETDLYAWIVQHQEELEDELGWEVDATSAAQDLVQRFSPDPQHIFNRVKERVLRVLTPERLEAGPPPGQWREEILGPGHEQNLFCNLLVPVASGEGGLDVLEQALIVARRESGRVHGLHVLDDEREDDRSHLGPLQEAFEARCAEAGIDGDLTIETGQVSPTICDHAYWNDLVVMGLSHLPGPHLTERLSSGFSTLVRRCGRPVLAVPGSVSPLDKLLLAYDGSPKAKEALFVAAYLSGKWQRSLTVVSVAGEQAAERSAAQALTQARQYLQSRSVHAFYMLERGDVASALQRAAEAQGSDLIIMGGYGFRPLLEVILGSTVDEVLRWRRWPVLICR